MPRVCYKLFLALDTHRSRGDGAPCQGMDRNQHDQPADGSDPGADAENRQQALSVPGRIHGHEDQRGICLLRAAVPDQKAEAIPCPGFFAGRQDLLRFPGGTLCIYCIDPGHIRAQDLSVLIDPCGEKSCCHGLIHGETPSLRFRSPHRILKPFGIAPVHMIFGHAVQLTEHFQHPLLPSGYIDIVEDIDGTDQGHQENGHCEHGCCDKFFLECLNDHWLSKSS